MATINGKSYSDVRNINLRGGALGTGLIRWVPPQSGVPALWSSNPFSSTDYGLYLNASGQLVYSSLGTATVLGSGGGGGTPSWEAIFALDSTFSKATVWTINNSSGDEAVLKLTNVGAGSGATLLIDNGGTGADVTGTAGWSVAKDGAGTFLSIDSATITNTTGNIILKATGAGVVTIGANTNTITMAKATTFSSTITVTDGLTDLISTSNVAAGLRLTNNTATTWGAAAASAGVAVIRSTSLTTGSLLRLQLTEANLTTGNYVDCYDVTGGGLVFEVGEAGATTIGGVAGSNVFTVTAGDAVLSDGSLFITDNDNANSFAVTNDTATTASIVEIAGSGVFSGTTTGAFMQVTASGLTTGTLLYLVAAAATTSVAVVDIAAGTTSGSVLRLTTGTATFTTGGKMIELTSTAAVAGNHLTATTTGAYSGTGMILVTAGAATTGVLVSVISTTGLTSGSLIRATTSTAGALATNGAISFTATGDFTSTSAVNGGFVEIKANSTTAGTITNIVGSALTTGIALQLSNGTSGMTSGSLIRVTASGTGAIATNGVVSFAHAGVFTSTTIGFVNVIVSGAVAGTGLAVQMSAASQTTGIGFRVDQSNTTTGYTGNLVQITASSTTGASNALAVIGVNTTAGNVVNISNNALTLGSGTGLLVSHTTSVLGAGTSLVRISSTSIDTGTTTGVLLDLSSTAGTTATQVLGTFSALTTGIGMSLSTAALTTGTVLLLSVVEATIQTTGFYLRCFDGAANDFSISKYGATVIAGNALGTAALTVTAGDLVLTSGNVFAGGKVIFNGTETIVAGGTTTALNLAKSLHYIDADAGGDAFTLADGVAGQVTTILLTSSTGTATITPANLAGGTNVLLNADGESVILQFMDTEWFIIGGNGYVIS